MTLRSTLLAGSFLCALLVAPFAMAQPSPGTTYAIANMETRLAAVEDQMRALTGKVEQVDFMLRRLEETLAKMQGDYDQRLSDLERRPAMVAAPPSAPLPTATPQTHTEETEPDETQQQPVGEVSGSLGQVKVQGNKVTGGAIAPKAPPLPKTPPDFGLTPQEQYDHAFGLLRQADYDGASGAFKRFIDKNPNDKLIDNAKYWYAETFYVRGKFNDSAVAFAEAFQQNPKGTKAPDALLKLAMSLAAMEKKDDACGALKALALKYPKAPASIRKRAEQETARLKCK